MDSKKNKTCFTNLTLCSNYMYNIITSWNEIFFHYKEGSI